MSDGIITSKLLSREYWNSTVKMSLSKFFILCVLQDKELHGYDISKEVEQKTNGCCSPKEGTVYPILKEFTAGNLVTFQTEIVSGRERKIYSITENGRKAFNIGLEEWTRISKCLLNCKRIIDTSKN